MPRNHIGLDLSKARLDIHDPRTGRDSACPNTAAGIRRFLARLEPDDMLVFEATSGCDRTLLRLLAEDGHAHVRLNPLHVWHFAQSLNLAKTDRVDARMLARLGRERQPEPDRPGDPARADLADLTHRRDQLKRMQVQEKNRLARTDNPTVARDIRASLRTLARRIARFEAGIAAHLSRQPDLAGEARLLASIPGIGPVVAAGLLAHLPELGRLDRRAIASLGGLAPKARDSGARKGHRRIGQGRRHVRRLLYMAALATWRRPGPLRGFQDRLRQAGKAPKLILIALARKLLTIANAVLRDATPFRNTPA